MSDIKIAPAGAMLAALESIQQSVETKAKMVPIDLKFKFEFVRVSTTECRIEARFRAKNRPWKFTGCDLMKEIDKMEEEIMAIIDPLVAVYEKAKERNVEIKLQMLESTVQECHPPIYSETWKIDVGEWTKTGIAYSPVISLVMAASKEAPLLL